MTKERWWHHVLIGYFELWIFHVKVNICITAKRKRLKLWDNSKQEEALFSRGTTQWSQWEKWTSCKRK